MCYYTYLPPRLLVLRDKSDLINGTEIIFEELEADNYFLETVPQKIKKKEKRKRKERKEKLTEGVCLVALISVNVSIYLHLLSIYLSVCNAVCLSDVSGCGEGDREGGEENC